MFVFAESTIENDVGLSLVRILEVERFPLRQLTKIVLRHQETYPSRCERTIDEEEIRFFFIGRTWSDRTNRIEIGPCRTDCYRHKRRLLARTKRTLRTLHLKIIEFFDDPLQNTRFRSSEEDVFYFCLTLLRSNDTNVRIN
ncbi:hypothetical protein Zmor_024784 [Zophobas morio]|uniref:Uncharacterized protein n=1 Tax=Zophobas morio TaxID=2755281 RepID=A0AA38M900_9CUCU|nr:hypothetical protein Zmor_024784 [Zophobas morio]